MNQAEKTRQTKQKIRQTALELFSKQGFAETSVKDICAASGYSIGAFYHHFNSKANILDDTYSAFDAYIEATFDPNQYDTARAGIEAIKTLFKEQIAFSERFIVNKYRFELTSLVDLVKTGQTQHEFKPELNPREIAGSIFRLSVGDIYMWCLNEGSFDLEKTVAFDLKLVLDSIAVK